MLTVNGRIQLLRRWWFSRDVGSIAPADVVVDRQSDTVTRGVREMACRENQGAASFDKAAENLARTAQIRLSGEQLRLVVEKEGRTVQAAQQTGVLDPVWTSADCAVVEEGRVVPDKTRVYTGVDGVMVPIITQAEKLKRRAKVKEKRRKCGQKRRPLPPLRKGADRDWKEFKVVYFYDELMKHQHVAVTHLNHATAGRLMRREADRLGFRKASERIANVDGARGFASSCSTTWRSWTVWAWIFTTWARTCIARSGWCLEKHRPREKRGQTTSCTCSSTKDTPSPGSGWCNGERT